MKKVTKTNKRRSTGQSPGTKSARGPAGQQRVLFFHWFTENFICSCFRRDVQNSCLRHHGGQEGRLFPGRTDPSASRPALPRPLAPPRRAPPCPDPPVVCPGFGFDNFEWEKERWGVVFGSSALDDRESPHCFFGGILLKIVNFSQLLYSPREIYVSQIVGLPFFIFNSSHYLQSSMFEPEQSPDLPCMIRIYRDK